MDAVTVRYSSGQSLKSIADEFGLNPIKAHKLLITARVYESDVAEKLVLEKNDKGDIVQYRK